MSISFSKLKNKLGLDDVLPFGRHQGYTVEEVLKDRPEYISWLMSNTTLRFYPSVHEMLLLIKPKRIPQHISFRYESHNIYSDQDDWFDDIPF